MPENLIIAPSFSHLKGFIIDLSILITIFLASVPRQYTILSLKYIIGRVRGWIGGNPLKPPIGQMGKECFGWRTMADKFDTSILIRLSKAEKLAWQEKAVLAGMTLTSLIRQSMKKVKIVTKVDHGLIGEQICQIRRIGINLNQIARWANVYKSTAETIEVIEVLREIEESLKQLSIKELSSFPSAQEKGEEEDVS